MNPESFNKFYANIGINMAKTLQDKPLIWKNPECIHEFKFETIEKESVHKCLKSISNRRNLDILGFDSKLLKICSNAISDTLCKLFNISIKSGVIPEDWKIGRITPVYKGDGDILTESNYRPISVIGHVAKIMELNVKNQFISYLTENKLITIDQSAYLKQHSTVTCLHRVIEDWREIISDKNLVGTCFLDISKCFDSIDHSILICKLEKYGVKGIEKAWFTNYLTNRQQVVKCNNKMSQPLNVEIGVPQGSILGPILFLLFINDLTQHCNGAQCNLFADDALFYVYGKDLNEVNIKLQNCIKSVEDWYQSNKLTLNAKKSNVMLVHNSNRIINKSLNITVNTTKLDQVDHVKYLGVWLDEKLQWHHHINSICKKTNKKLAMLNRVSEFLPQSSLLSIYKSFIMPTFDYADTIWHPCNKFLSHKVQVLQNRAARIIFKNFDYINTRGLDLVKQLNIQNTYGRREYRMCIMMFKCIHGKVPTYLSDYVVMACDIHKYGTRQAESMNVHIPPFKTKFHQNSFFCQGGYLWNNLPSNLKENTSLDSFKKSYMSLIKMAEQC
jgi:hypothetical protein